MKKPVYLDYAAATPVDPEVAKLVEQAQLRYFANPSSMHSPGRAAAGVLTDARKSVARILGAKPAEIIFTSGSTEAANLAVGGVAAAFPGGRIVVSAIEHEAVLRAAEHFGGARQPLGVLPVTPAGTLSPEQALAAIDDATVLVCAQYANNEIGSIQPLGKISSMIAQVRKDRAARGNTTPLYLYCDAAQAGLLSLQVSRLSVDLMSMGGSKLYGPPGIGFLYIRAGVRLDPLIFGGGQQSGLRGGTPPVALAAGLAAALEKIQASRTAESKRQQKLRDWIWGEIQGIEGIGLNGARSPRLPGNLNIRFDGLSGETLLSYLDAAGFAVATGSACSAANEEPSHVLRAIGLSLPQARSSLRVTLGRHTGEREAKSFARALISIVARLQRMQKR